MIGCPEHQAKAARIIDRSITLVKNARDQLPLDPQKHRRIIIYPVQSGGLTAWIRNIAFGGRRSQPARMLAEELWAQGFEPTVYKVNLLKYLSPHGVNGKKAPAELSVAQYTARYDAAIVLCNVGSFSTTHERSLHWTIPMGPEIPTIAISLAHPFHLIDLAVVPTYVNTYNAGREAIRQTVQKLMGRSPFRGVSPVDAFCGRWDTRL